MRLAYDEGVAVLSKLDVVLVNPGGQEQIYQSLSGTLTAHEPPVWAGLIATYLRQSGCSRQIVDALVERLFKRLDKTAPAQRDMCLGRQSLSERGAPFAPPA